MTISCFMKIAETFPKRVENTFRKGEIAHYVQFLLLPQCTADTLKPELVWERVKCEICGSGFLQKSNMERHRVVHYNI